MSDSTDSPAHIKVTKNGPYKVTGNPPLSKKTMRADAEGNSVAWEEGEAFATTGKAVYLCRCGHSANKPFCDSTHARVGFDGTETAPHVDYSDGAKLYEGPELSFTDNKPLCARARFCDVKTTVWEQYKHTDQPEVARDFVTEINNCPSGRLRALRNSDHRVIEEPRSPAIGVVEDQGKDVSGPLWVEGGITVESADGFVYERRNRVTLCRCGQSKNKPFCDGSHIPAGFKDGL